MERRYEASGTDEECSGTRHLRMIIPPPSVRWNTDEEEDGDVAFLAPLKLPLLKKNTK